MKVFTICQSDIHVLPYIQDKPTWCTCEDGKVPQDMAVCFPEDPQAHCSTGNTPRVIRSERNHKPTLSLPKLPNVLKIPLT